MIASVGLILVEIGDVVSAHIRGDHHFLTYIVCFFLAFPSLLYFLSLLTTLPEKMTASFPLLIGSFLIVEGLMSFFMGD